MLIWNLPGRTGPGFLSWRRTLRFLNLSLGPLSALHVTRLRGRPKGRLRGRLSILQSLPALPLWLLRHLITDASLWLFFWGFGLWRHRTWSLLQGKSRRRDCLWALLLMPRKAACRKPSDPTQCDQVHAGEAVGVQDELAEGQARVQGDFHPAPVGSVMCGSVMIYTGFGSGSNLSQTVWSFVKRGGQVSFNCYRAAARL